MKKLCFLFTLLIVVAVASANVELTINGDFDGNVDGWAFSVNQWAGMYEPAYDVALIGWTNGRSIYQNTGAVFQANSVYTLKTLVSSPTRTNDHQFEGAQPVLISVDNGVWTDVATLDYMFPPEDRLAGILNDPGTFREVTMTFNTADNPSIVGTNIGVGVRSIDNSDWGQYGFLYMKYISLTYPCAIPTSPPNDTDVEDGLNAVGAAGDNGIDVLLEWTTMRDPADANGILINPDVTAHYVNVVENEPNFASPEVVTYTVDNGTVGETGSLLLEDLNPESAYYWRVDESINGTAIGDPNTVIGVVQAFETIPTQVVFLSQPSDVLVPDGASAQFTVGYFSIADVEFAWYQSDDLVQDPLTDTPFGADANTVTLTDISLADGDEQTYVYCVANNGGADVYSDMALVEIERLMGHWTLDSTLESTPAGQPGTAVQTSFVGGVEGNAAEMLGDPNYIVTIAGSETAYNNFHLGLSISMWVNTTHDGWQILAGKQDRAADPRDAEWTLNMTPAGKAQITGSGGGIAGATSNVVINDGAWHLVTVTFDGGVRKIYIDGLLDVETGAQGAINPENMNTAPFEIGGESATGAVPAQSMIDDVRVYNYALGATDVIDLYNQFDGPISACVLEYAQFVDIANSDTGLMVGEEGFEQDCKVNLDDFAAMASAWLSCGLYPEDYCL